MSVGAATLATAAQEAALTCSFEPAPPTGLREARELLGLSPELVTWYETLAPRRLTIPWVVEWMHIYEPASLVERQEGYRWQAGDRGKRLPSWLDQWVAIGDWSGDPVIADTSTSGTPISMAVHGIGRWDPSTIAPDLGSYLTALATWIDVCIKEYGRRFTDDDALLLPEVKAKLRARLTEIVGADLADRWVEPR